MPFRWNGIRSFGGNMAAGCARVLVVDDDPRLLASLGKWLAASGYEVLAASDGRSALALAREAPVDVVVTDMRMPGLSGLDLLGLLKELDPAIAVIILTGDPTLEDSIEALRHGRAFDFLRKPLADPSQLNVVIEQALSKRHREGGVPRMDAAVLDALSAREREVLALLARGVEIADISLTLCLSEKTVRNYLSNIYQHLEVPNRTQAVIIAQRLGLR